MGKKTIVKNKLDTPELGKNPFVVPLTDEELESLKLWTAEVKKYFRKQFQDELRLNNNNIIQK